MFSQPGKARMATRLIAEKAAQAASSSPGRNGQLTLRATLTRPESPPASVAGELIAFTAHRLDQVEAKLGPQAPHAHVDDVRARVEVIPPHGCQQLPLRHGLARMLRKLAEPQELQPGQRHRPRPDVGDKAAHVEGEVAGPDGLAAPPGNR